MGEKRAGKLTPKGIRKAIVNRSCVHAVVKIKLSKHWQSGDWIYLRFEAKAQGNYLVKEAIVCCRQWQRTYSHGKATPINPGTHEYNAAKLHAVKAIETMRRRYGDQQELFD